MVPSPSKTQLYLKVLELCIEDVKIQHIQDSSNISQNYSRFLQIFASLILQVWFCQKQIKDLAQPRAHHIFESRKKN